MAINIQEILHPSDSNQIKWEKVNYNFDQILANGGGLKGNKGSEGIQGSVGLTGQKGQKGDIGPQGETGATSSRWKVIPVTQNAGNVNQYVILKPKVSNDTYHPVIFLGDQEFDEINGLDGFTTSRATLTIGRHAKGGPTPSSELLTYWHGKRGNTQNDISITLSTSEQTDGTIDWTRFELNKQTGPDEENEVVEYFVNLDKYTFRNTNVSFGDNSTESVFRLPETNGPALEGGELRYFGGTFQGAVKDSNGFVTWKSFCMSPCGQGGGDPVSISITPSDDLNVNQYGGPMGNTVEIIPGGDLEVDDEGALWNGNVTDATTTVATTTEATTTEATTTEATTTQDKTIAFGPDNGNYNNISYAGGQGSIDYTTGPVDGLIIESISDVTAPEWIEILGTMGADNGPELSMKIEANAAGIRSGNIIIRHPQKNAATATLNVTQQADPSYGAGCTDANADNYNPNATGDDGSCTYCANFTAIEVSKTNPSEWGGSDGTYAMTASGGSGNYDINVYQKSDDQQVNPFALAAGEYYGVITDLGTKPNGDIIGCTDQLDFTITNPTTVATTLATDATTLATDATTQATVAKYTTTWTAGESVSNATVHVSDSPGASVDNTDTRIATAGTGVSRTFYMKPASGYQFTSTSQVSATVSQGNVSVDSITANGSIKINVAHTTNTSNNAIVVTITGGAVSSAPVYTGISANPSGTVNEGQQVTVSVTGNNIPNGTRVWVNMNLGAVNQQDVTSGWSSGAGSGDSPSNSSWGNWVTMNGNTGSHTITLKNDNSLEGTETLVFSLLSYDEASNATGSLQTSVDVLDTSYPQTYTVTFINGNYNQYSTCQLTSGTKTAVYNAPSVGKATWTTVKDAIFADSDYTGSAGVWFKIVSSTEPGFLHGDGTANHSAPLMSQPCSGVTTTTTTTDSGSGSGATRHTIANYSNNYGSVSYMAYSISGGLTTATSSVGPYQSLTVCAVPGSFSGGNSGGLTISNSGQVCS